MIFLYLGKYTKCGKIGNGTCQDRVKRHPKDLDHSHFCHKQHNNPTF